MPWSDFARFMLVNDGVRLSGHVETRGGQVVRCVVLTPGGQRHVGEELQPLVDHLNSVAEGLRKTANH